jgi:predicted DNA-binding protein (MmcQ/YjbR family)
MATAKKALEKMREICLSLPETSEGHHYGETAFRVGKKLFATCGEKNGTCEIVFGLEPDHAAALVEGDPRFKPYPRDRRGVVLEVAKVKNWSEVKALIHESYRLQKAAKKKPVTMAPPRKRPRAR